MKFFKKIAVSAMMLAMVVTTVVPTTSAFAKTGTETTQDNIVNYDVKVKVKSFTSTQLSWKKKKVDEFRIYKYSYITGKSKLLKTVSGKATSCTLKTEKNKNYNIYVDGIKYNKNKKAVIKYRGWAYFVSGIAPFDFEEYDYAEADTSANYIKLSFLPANDGMVPDGYEVYRSYYDDELFDKIATVKKSNYKKNAKSCIEYTDKKVEFGETYYYKVRGYKKINGKTYYSKFSAPIAHKAVNNEGYFDVKKTVDGDMVTLAVASDPGNDSFQLDIESIMNACLDEFDENATVDCCQLKEFKFNGVSWTTPVKNYTITVDAGDTMYFTFKLPEKKDPDSTYTYSIEYITYNGFVADFILDIDNAKAQIYLNGEFIH